MFCFINFISTSSFSQTANTLPTNGDVGIGTLIPSAKLDVNGRMKVDSNAIFKDSVNIKKRLTVDQDIKVLGKSVFVDDGKFKSDLKVLGIGKMKSDLVIDGLTKMNGDAKVFGDLKIKSLADPTLTSERIMAINPNGKVKGLGGADLFKLIYQPPSACIQLPNGKIITGWQQNTSFPTYGVLYTTDECPVRVGIRTDNPQATLHVKGSFQLENGTQGINKVLVSDVNGKATWKNSTSISDWTTATNGTDIYRPAGNVGIGTATPLEPLHVSGNVRIGNQYTTNITLGYPGPSPSFIKQFIGFNLSNDGTNWLVNNGGQAGASGILTKGSGKMIFTSIPAGAVISDESLSNDYAVMTISQGANEGVVKLGGANRGADLFVNGIIKSNRIEVRSTTWPDFVFKDDYVLKPLTEVETYIKANKHLPDVPSEKEVKENGIDLAKMDAILLQKIEELTLYNIALNKRLKKLENKQ